MKRPVTSLLALLLTAAFFAPIVTIFGSWVRPDWAAWDHVQENLLLELTLNSIGLTFLVVCGSLFVGVISAVIVVFSDIPYKKLLSTLLVMPLAMPPYVLGFTYLGVTDYGSPFREKFSAIAPLLEANFDPRSVYGAAFSLTMSLFPYVFLLTRQAFLSNSQTLIEAARSLGCSPRQAIWKLALPMAKPFLLSAAVLVGLETMADFGTVSVFSYDTFTTGVYKTWFGLFSVNAAGQLASLLLGFVALLGSSHFILSRNKRKTFATHQRREVEVVFKSRVWKLFGAGFISALIGFSLIIPSCQLIVWSIASYFEYGVQTGSDALEGTLEVALISALAVLTLNLFVALTRRHDRRLFATRILSKVALLGYAIPGAVLAVGVIRPMIWVDIMISDFFEKIVGVDWFAESALMSGSILALVFGLSIRFYSIGISAVENGLKRLPASLEEAGRSLGASTLRIQAKVIAPLLAPSVGIGLVMVFVEVMKEMPLTLMTRPFGWDTLAVKIFEFTSEGEWERAAQPSVMLTIAGLIPVYLLLNGARNIEPS